MRIGMRVAYIVFTLILMTVTVQAGNSKVGTSGAQFLKIGAGARPTAMGEAFTGIADDVNAVYYNPAGLAFLMRPEITAMHTQWFQGLNYEFGAFVYPTDHGSFGFSAATLKADDLEKRNADESFQGNFETLDAAYALSYAKNFSPTFSVGLTGRFINQEIDTVSANTWSGDVGLMKKMTRWPMSFGLAVKHFGQKVEFTEDSDPQPLTIVGGTGLNLLGDKILLGLDIKKPRDNDVQFGVGSEWRQKLFGETRFALRAGYNTSGTDPDGTTGVSLGGGFGFKQLELDFAWVPFGDLGDTFRYAALFRF